MMQRLLMMTSLSSVIASQVARKSTDTKGIGIIWNSGLDVEPSDQPELERPTSPQKKILERKWDSG
jgi:hypothetical protein